MIILIQIWFSRKELISYYLEVFIHLFIHSLLQSRAVLCVTALLHRLDQTDGLALNSFSLLSPLNILYRLPLLCIQKRFGQIQKLFQWLLDHWLSNLNPNLKLFLPLQVLAWCRFGSLVQIWKPAMEWRRVVSFISFSMPHFLFPTFLTNTSDSFSIGLGREMIKGKGHGLTCLSCWNLILVSSGGESNTVKTFFSWVACRDFSEILFKI